MGTDCEIENMEGTCRLNQPRSGVGSKIPMQKPEKPNNSVLFPGANII